MAKEKTIGTLGKTRDQYIEDEVRAARQMYSDEGKEKDFDEKKTREGAGKYYDEQKSLEDSQSRKKKILDGFMSGSLFNRKK